MPHVPHDATYSDAPVTLRQRSWLNAITHVLGEYHPQYYDFWCMLLADRVEGSYLPSDFAVIPERDFDAHKQRCLDGINAARAVDIALQTLNVQWRFGFKERAPINTPSNVRAQIQALYSMSPGLISVELTPCDDDNDTGADN